MSFKGMARRLQPRNFSWFIECKLAGLALPSSKSDVEFLRENGVRELITLTEEPLSQDLRRKDMTFTHIPITDLTPPSLDQVNKFLKIVEERNSNNEAVAVHCAYGKGRVGTMLACYLVKHKAYTANDAVIRVRTKRPGSVETIEQEKLVGKFAASLK